MMDGAVIADLNEYKLGNCILLKSNGTGLYATKDLSLATRKFDQFNIDTSIYIVDESQSLHFARVFKVLELMGYDQASRCVHIPYGLVTIPSGKMSSRKGTVILFNALKSQLEATLSANMQKYVNVWPAEEIKLVVRRLCVGTIKYGMLNHDVAKDVVFRLNEWADPRGNTGPYLMYAYARIRAIFAKVAV